MKDMIVIRAVESGVWEVEVIRQERDIFIQRRKRWHV